MDDSSIFGGFQPPPVAHQAGDLCPRCGDPCVVAGRCQQCFRLLGAISTDSTIDREEHRQLVQRAISHARAYALRDELFQRARCVA